MKSRCEIWGVDGKDNMKNSGGKYPPDLWKRLNND